MLSTDKIVRQQGAFQFDGEGGGVGYPDERQAGGGMEQGGAMEGFGLKFC